MPASERKTYSKDDMATAMEEVTAGMSTIHRASKKYRIPFTTLRDRTAKKRNKLCCKYSEESLLEAVSKIKSGLMTTYAAAKAYNIPKATLMNRVKNLHNKKHGSEKILSDEVESQIAEWIILCSRAGYPKSKGQILHAAAEIGKLNSTKHFLNDTPTTGWFNSFSKRHPEISKRTPEALGKASAAITVEGLRNFFRLVEDQLREADRLDLLHKPQQWWNIDETGFEMNPTPRAVYAETGAKTVHIIERGKSKENITCTYAVRGDGDFIPPLVTFKEAFASLDVAAYVSKDIGANFGFNNTETGWMKGDSFYFFVTEHLYPRWVKMEAEFPIVLVVDGYSSHKNTELFVWCKEHDVILLLLYPNSTHILQVLDIAIFGPLKLKYSDFYEQWKLLHPNDNFTELEFIKVLKATNDAVLNVETIVNGWRATGLQPFKFENVNTNILVTDKSSQSFEYHGYEAIMTLAVDFDEFGNQTELELTEISDMPEDACVIATSASLSDMEALNMEASDMEAPDMRAPDVEVPHIEIPETSSLQNGTEDSKDSGVNNDSSNTTVSFSDIHKNIGLFSTNFDDHFSESAFRFDQNDCSEIEVVSTDTTSANTHIKKLVDKIRGNIRQLGMNIKVHHPEKLLNILVMAQQLDIISPKPSVVQVSTPITPKDILTVPTVPRTKRIRKKLSFGVMSDVEIVNEIEDIVEAEMAQQREAENVQLNDIQKSKDANELQANIQQIQLTLAEERAALKKLKEEKSAERKEAAKRKASAAIDNKKKRGEKQFKLSNVPDSSAKRAKK